MEAEKERIEADWAQIRGVPEDSLTNPGTNGLPPDFPCGVLRCTCEKYPRVLYASDQMLTLLGTTRDSEDWRDLIRQNIFFMIPFEERHAFRHFLELAGQGPEPVSMEHRVRNCSGGYTNLIGWLRREAGAEGNAEYHFAYMRMPEGRLALQEQRERAYQNALRDVYDVMFQVDLAQRTIECVHKKPNPRFRFPYTVRMMLDDVVRPGFFEPIHEEDRAVLQAFFTRLTDPGCARPADDAARIEFRVLREGQTGTCLMNAVWLDDRTVLLCCRDITQEITMRSLSRKLEDLNASITPALSARPRVFIRTFGYFDVFVDGKPVVFRHEKSKELLAVLVDRCGSFVSNPYIISCIWGEEPYGEKVQGRCRQTAYRLMETLEQYGIADIIERVDRRRRIVPERIECDYFDYKEGKPNAERLFNGAYMSDYSWGEVTLSSLLKERNP